jgi:hypothetical protein
MNGLYGNKYNGAFDCIKQLHKAGYHYNGFRYQLICAAIQCTLATGFYQAGRYSSQLNKKREEAKKRADLGKQLSDSVSKDVLDVLRNCGKEGKRNQLEQSRTNENGKQPSVDSNSQADNEQSFSTTKPSNLHTIPKKTSSKN